MQQLNFFSPKKGSYVDITDGKEKPYRIWLSKNKKFSLSEAIQEALKVYNKEKGINLTKDNNLVGFGEIVLNGKIFRKKKKEVR
ncbi:MAG: hypothetical protein PHU82_00395 [Candidatus Pacebacteria bacterium]|jgi:hypothetical protein|nr:hypothetical protein [Candidatus Paceibacterota bacterium]MDD4994436.1 hypothetical protein [Candidatus Paceibacterota bacterium]